MTAQILCGDSVEMLRTLADGSVELCVTSPPYDALRTYNSHCVWDFHGTARELFRVLREGGVCCWNVGDSVVDGSETLTSFRQALFFKDACGFWIHDTMIWHKPNFSNPSSNRYHQLFEYIFILSKGKPRCFNPIKDKPNKYPNGPWGRNTFRKPNGEMGERSFKPASAFGMRGNVWSGNTVGQESAGKAMKHPAMMPQWLARDLILSFSNRGDTLLDPFCGSGTSCIQAITHGRNCIGIDIDPESIGITNAALARIPTEMMLV